MKVTESSTMGPLGEKLKAALGDWLGGSITSIVLLIVSVPPSRSSTSKVTVCGPPDENALDALDPVAS